MDDEPAGTRDRLVLGAALPAGDRLDVLWTERPAPRLGVLPGELGRPGTPEAGGEARGQGRLARALRPGDDDAQRLQGGLPVGES